MKRFNQNWAGWAVFVGGTVFSLGIVGSLSLPAVAQIVPDDTLGAEGSRIVRDVLIRGGRADRIEGGAARGVNLFYSFREFNVGEGERVYFDNPAAIANIFSRVTGNDISDIMGTLGVDGGANLYLLNPNGIIFGPNARLDVAGSFVASTGDRFIFSNGEEFSAVDPQAPPLLTINVPIGLQYGANPQGLIRNQGILSAGGDLTLDASRLELQGQLRAGGDLTLQAQDTLTIRDSATTPFIALSGQNLLVQGNQGVDIFALNHPESGLFAGNDLTLRSATPVIGDAHYWSGGNLRIEQLDESLGALTSPNDPVIRAAGNVSFDSYEGASLHIFAGGSVIVLGAIVITGTDPVNGIVETVTLSDGSIVAINGRTTPTLDIRAGTLAVNLVEAIGDTTGFVPGVPALGTGATSADITIGSIRNRGGTVFLTNQYQPNLGLPGGDIDVGAIDTSIEAPREGQAPPNQLTELAVRGGDVVIDSRGNIEISEAVNTSVDAGSSFFDFVNFIGEGNAIGDVTVEVAGGDIRLLAQDAIMTRNLNSSASTYLTLSVDQNEVVDADGNLVVTGGTIGDLTSRTTGGAIALESGTSITAATIDSSAVAVLEADAGAEAEAEGDATAQATGGEIGNVTLTTTGGTIVLESGTSITATVVDSSANAVTESEEEPDPGEEPELGVGAGAGVDAEATTRATGGRIGDVTLTTRGGAIALESGTSITAATINSSAEAVTDADADANADRNATGGVIGNVTLTTIGGAIALESGTFITTTAIIDSSANAVAEAEAQAEAGAGEVAEAEAAGNVVGNVTLITRGGAITLESGTSITTTAIDSSAAVVAEADTEAAALGGGTSGWR